MADEALLHTCCCSLSCRYIVEVLNDRFTGGSTMGLAWQQGPLGSGPIGKILVPQALPERILYAEPLRRRMRVVYDEKWLVDSNDVVLLHEPGHYPVAFFPLAEIAEGAITATDRVTPHKEFGPTKWFTVNGQSAQAPRAAWTYPDLPDYAEILANRVAFSWRHMDGYFEEDERILGHAADPYHRIDIRQTSRHLVVKIGDQVIADSTSPLALYESGFAPRWYVPRKDVKESGFTLTTDNTFCPYKGLCSYWEIEGRAQAAWGYLDPYTEVTRIKGHYSFEPEVVDVFIDGVQQSTPPGQTVISHGEDRALDVSEFGGRSAAERDAVDDGAT
jgi:uncharacterized protein (DUF427 family)